MADLAKMFGKPQGAGNDKEQVGAPSAVAESGPATRAGCEDSGEGGDQHVPEPATAAGVKGNPFARKAAAAGAQDPQAESAPQAQDQSGGSDAAESTPKGRLAGFRFAQVPGKAGSAGPASDGAADRKDGTGVETVQSVRTAIDSLEDLEASEDPGTVPASTRSSFADETPATAPTRDLPEGLEKQQLQFVDLIDGVYQILYDPELLGSVIKSIMIELKSNPQYMKLVAKEDVRTWIRAMRDSMGLARVKKVEAKAKRSGGSRTKANVDTDMLADLDELGIKFD